ncbi:hypothetical protein LRE06_10875 [Halorhodospira halophila]|uniref:hypothetical protein n=1 Tax=Halorhodospira halophila TaxID=1053 RepID=UPI001EE87963|nr:hypothetical protein [Halorhodospira halophila]MCG5528839.1 hypothetical protein [Halorhodospira halophila]MCG5544225.1 hypothetical protein [Halorhodospira sp. 9628]
MALRGARRPERLEPLDGLAELELDDAALREIDRILEESVTDPVGPEFMAPPSREEKPA